MFPCLYFRLLPQLPFNHYHYKLHQLHGSQAVYSYTAKVILGVLSNWNLKIFLPSDHFFGYLTENFCPSPSVTRAHQLNMIPFLRLLQLNNVLQASAPHAFINVIHVITVNASMLSRVPDPALLIEMDDMTLLLAKS